MATRLEEDRAAIDRIDEQLAKLFEQRFNIVRDIIEYKYENRLPILDSGRETEIIERNSRLVEDDDIRRYFRITYAHMIELSREYQDDILKEK